MRVGLVLGAGGVVGASWLIGSLAGIEEATGWRASDAEYVVGTSAGSVVGTLAATGFSPDAMADYATDRPVDELELPGAEAAGDRQTGDGYRLHPALPPIGPGSWRLALRTLRDPRRHAPTTVALGWLPRGMVSTAPISALVDRFVDGPWPAHPNLWVVGCDYDTGARVPFGRDGAPAAHIRDAVAASCAIPAFYHPVSVDGRRYVDGGVCSLSNADLLAGRDLDLVVCLNPTSSRARMPGNSPADRIAASMRERSGKRLGHELAKLRDQGTETLVLQPTADDLSVMGTNLMARDRRLPVIEQARRSAIRTAAASPLAGLLAAA
jgi:NTE family protein